MVVVLSVTSGPLLALWALTCRLRFVCQLSWVIQFGHRALCCRRTACFALCAAQCCRVDKGDVLGDIC
jgi:hypothetical protein